MRILSWNCQGLGPPLTVCHLKALCLKYKPGIVFLMETRQQSGSMDKIRRKLGFDKGGYVIPREAAGGLPLWWRDDIKLQIFEKSDNF